MLDRLMIGLALLALPLTSGAQGRITNIGGSVSTRYHYSSVSRKNMHALLPTPYTRADIDMFIQAAHDLDQTLIRSKIYWSRIEPTTKGVFVWDGFTNASGPHVDDTDYLMLQAHNYGIQVVVEYGESPGWSNGSLTTRSVGPPVLMADYADFITELCNRYKPGGTFSAANGWAVTDRVIYATEVFNEPNNDDGNWVVWDGNSFENEQEPARWAEMINAVLVAGHAADPGMIVAAGTMCFGCVPFDWNAYLTTALTTMNMPDAQEFTGNYNYKTLDELNADIGAKAKTMRNKYRLAFGQAGATVPFWCMECGGGGSKCLTTGTYSQVNQVNEASIYYDQDGALDQWRLDQTKFIDRIFWETLFDNCELSGSCTFNNPGLVFYPPTFPVYEKPIVNTTTCVAHNPPDPDPGTCKQNDCVTPGLKKLGYDQLKNATANIP